MHKDHSTFNEILDRIYEGSNTKTQIQLAKLLGVQQSSISDAKKRSSIPDSWLIALLEECDLNPKWVMNGIQPKYINTADKHSPFPIENTVNNKSTLPLGNNTQSQSLKEERSTKLTFSDSFLSLPVYSSLYCGEVDDENNKIFEIEEEFYLSKKYAQESTMLFRVNGKNMEPTILNNGIVAIDTKKMPLISGEIYLFCLPLQGIYISKIFHSNKEENHKPCIDLVPDNKTFPTTSLNLEQAEEYLLGKVFCIFNLI